MGVFRLLTLPRALPLLRDFLYHLGHVSPEEFNRVSSASLHSSLYYRSSADGGVITVTLDESQVTFNRYNPTPRICDMVAFNRDGLSNVNHTFTMSLTSNSPTGSTVGNGYVDWEYLT